MIILTIFLNNLRVITPIFNFIDKDDITNGETDEDKQQEIKKLKFIATKTAAKNTLTDANKNLDEIMKKPTPKVKTNFCK